MKNKRFTALLPCLILGMGGICAAMRALMYALYTDSNGLLRAPNILSVMIALFAIVTVVTVIAAVRPLGGTNGYAENFSRSVFGGCSAILAAVGILFCIFTQKTAYRDFLTRLTDLLGIFSALSLVIVGVCRIGGKKPNFMLYGMVCLYFALRLVDCYRDWSSCPQFHSYLWQLFAGIGLMCVGYYHAAFSVGLGNRKRMIACGLITAFMCLPIMVEEDCGFFYCACGLWALFDTCRLFPPRAMPSEEVADGE